jgi:hypothetical protein
MNISSIIDTISSAIEGSKTPVNILPPMLLRCTSLLRPGLSAYRIAAKVIQNNKALGIPTEENPDGQQNFINSYTYNIVKEIVSAIKNDASVQTSIPASSILVQATGGNAGGPVVCTGTNLLDSIATGIMQ